MKISMAEATVGGSQEVAQNFKNYGSICINSNASLTGGRLLVKNGQNYFLVVIEWRSFNDPYYE